MKIENISKSFGQKQVLKNFSATLEKGRTTAIMGPSGCGKSTLLRIIAGLEKADGGTVSRDGERIAVLFQENRLCESLSASDNIRLVCRASEAQIKSVLTEMGLGADTESKVHTLSGGMKRRVAIARALLFDAPTVLLDEPFQGLDEQTKKTVASVMRRCLAGKTVLAVTHQRQDVELLDAAATLDMTK